MDMPAVKTRLPLPVVLLIAAAVVVVGLLILQAAIAFFVWLFRLALIVLGFIAIAWVASYLLRRGRR